MGYDVYGMNPQQNKDYPERYNKIMEEYGSGDGWLDWDKKIPKKVLDEYYDLKDKYETDNPGSYFRNNVWFWRPLWNYVCEVCEDFMTADEIDGGHSNSGFEIPEETAIHIAKVLSEKLADGSVDERERKYELRRAKAEAWNQEVRAEMDKISKECRDKHGQNKVPANYPEPYNTQWQEAYSKEDWSANYPYSKENIENFAKFCKQSGGFQIC
tara:strand:+ start:1944 stop:2582 length:639 start_codon:yes stop_codon:yes gene_type:complete